MTALIVVGIVVVVVVLVVIFNRSRRPSDPKEELKRLKEKMDGMSEPSDIMQKAQFSLLKAQAALLAQFPEIKGSADEKLASLSTCEQTVNTTAAMLGEGDTGIRTLRRMLSLARNIARTE